MLFWQLTYMTSVYLVSFFVADRQARISRGELYVYILAMNSPWILCPLLGLYVSVRLILTATTAFWVIEDGFSGMSVSGGFYRVNKAGCPQVGTGPCACPRPLRLS